MHDFHLANQIVKIVREYAQKNGLAKITKIVIELGKMSEHGETIEPKNLKYNINLLMPCEVKIKTIEGDLWKLVSVEGN